MTIRRSHLLVGTAIIAIAIGAVVARTRAAQEWFGTVKVQGKMTAYLLDDRAAVTGVLLEGGQQVRVGARLGEVIASRVRKGDVVSVVGRGGRATPFGRLVDARGVTINGHTVALADERGGPRGEPRGRGGRGRADGPGEPAGGRGGPAAPAGPGGRGLSSGPPPLPDERSARPLPDSGPLPMLPPALPHQPAPPDAPAPPAAQQATVHGTVSTFLVGPGGEVRGLILSSGEQVPLSPRVGEMLRVQAGTTAPEVTVVGEVVTSDYGIIVRAVQLTVGSQTILLE